MTAFEKYQHSSTHQEAVESLVLLPSWLQGDIDEICDQNLQEEKMKNRMFIR